MRGRTGGGRTGERPKRPDTVDFMLGQRRRQLTYINPALSILEHKQDRSTPAQCFLNVGPASQKMDQQ